MSYYYIFIGMAEIKNSDNEFWQGCEEIGALTHC